MGGYRQAHCHLAVVLLAHLTATLPRHTDRVATFPRVKPEDKPWEILCRR